MEKIFNSEADRFNVLVQHYVLKRGMTLPKAVKHAERMRKRKLLDKAYQLVMK